MEFDRWVVPPAAAAAVFATMAVVPPGGPAARGLRVEVAELHGSQPMLVRVVVDEPGTARWHAPHDATLTVVASDGTRSVQRATRSVHGARFLFATIPAPGPPPFTLDVDAEGLHGHAIVRALEASPVTSVPLAAGDHGVQIAIEGGALAPEVPGRFAVCVADGAGRSVSVAPTDASVRVVPPRATLDACGVARFDALVHGFDAHVVLTVSGAVETVVHRGLRVVPGGFALQGGERALNVTAAIAAQPVYLVGGDERGAAWWTEGLVSEPSGENAVATFALGPAIRWVVVSHTAALDAPLGEWLVPPTADRCDATPLGAYFARIAAAPPLPPRVLVVADGGQTALAAREVRKDHARRVALALSALAIALLVGLVLGSGLARDPSGLAAISQRARQRVLFSLAGACVLLVGGIVLLTAYALRM